MQSVMLKKENFNRESGACSQGTIDSVIHRYFSFRKLD